MLAGLKRLLEQGYFTESKTQQETEIEFFRASDTISAFLTEMAIFDKNIVTPRSKALTAYKNYCDVLGLDAENEKKFTQRLKETPKISVTLIRNPQERAWKGLSLKTIDDDGKITQNDTLDTHDTRVAYAPVLDSSKREGRGTPPFAVSSVSPVSRFCSEECQNFDKPSCVAPNWQSLNKMSELPLNCPGYSYVAAGEDP
jgi:hypothetical protein